MIEKQSRKVVCKMVTISSIWTISALMLLCGGAAEAFLCMCSPDNCLILHPSTQLLEAVEMYCPTKRIEAHDISIIRLIATKFPKAVFKNFPNMTSLELYQGSLAELEPGTFDGAEKLSKLMIKGNNVTNLGDNIFQGADNLKNLMLSSNPVETVSENTFENLRILELLVLAHGNLKSLPKQLLHNNRLLKQVSFSHNKISFIDSDMFVGLNELQKVDLSYNELTQFDQWQLKAPVVLLKNNSLEYLLINQYYTSVDANNNKIRAITVDGSQIERLELINNQIRDIANITKLTKLVSLSLGRNPLQPNSVFSQFTAVEELVLGSTYIKLTRATFNNLYNLKVLDLSYNNLSEIDFKIFGSQPSLQILSFVGNRIQSFNYLEAKEYLPKLHVLEICKNGWNSSYFEQNIEQMKKMHINPDIHGLASHFLFHGEYVDMCTEWANTHDELYDDDYADPNVSDVEDAIKLDFPEEKTMSTTTVPPSTTRWFMVSTTTTVPTTRSPSNTPSAVVEHSTEKVHHVSEHITKVAAGSSSIAPKEENGSSPFFIIFQVIAYMLSVVGLAALVAGVYLWKKRRICLRRGTISSGETVECDGDRLI